MKIHLIALSSAPFLAVPAFAQTAPAPAPQPAVPAAGMPKTAAPAPLPPLFSVGGFNFGAQLRTRVESFDYFEPNPGDNADGSYVFNGTQLRLNGLMSRPKYDIGLDFQAVGFLGLPDNATAPAPRGGLGLGANYFAANGEQDGSVGIKQAFVRLKGATGTGSSLRLGRFEFNDGNEIPAATPTLGWLKNQRISQRLVGTFGFSHVGRAFDGVHYTTPAGKGNFTGVAARPTTGVFDLDMLDNVDGVEFLYGAYTLPMKGSEARVFGLVYGDDRQAPQSVKVDNRPAAARVADTDEIKIYTLGANYIKEMPTSSGTFDFTAWGALQGGDWGSLDHSANAFDLEIGYQPKSFLNSLKPWFRLGYYQASGDGNNADGDHETFFTPLPTPRIYARFPFYNQMNIRDLSAEVLLRPNPKLSIRPAFRKLSLSKSSDLYYAGGGAFQDNSFGFAGRPNGGNRSLANLLDIQADYTINPTTQVSAYAARAFGKDVLESIYPNGKNATYLYLELTKRF